MTVYTYWANKDPQDGTSELIVRSGVIEIGQWGDLTDNEFAIISNSQVLLPGAVPGWTPDLVHFFWQTSRPPAVGGSGSGGGGGGGGPTYRYRTPGYNTTADLPVTGNSIDDATLTLDTGTLLRWDGSQWTSLAVFGATSGGTGGAILPLDGGAPDTIYTLIVDGGAPDTTYTLILDGGAP